jgi:GDPmannose 4,6-dehydratase
MKVIVFGANGQDGRILCQQLRASKHSVLGVGKTDLSNPLHKEALTSLLLGEKPDRIYYLAASHRSSEAVVTDLAKEREDSFRVHCQGWQNVVEGCLAKTPKTRLLYASSAHIFGNTSVYPQNETTALRPDCVYGESKVAGMRVSMEAREKHGLFVSHAILFPHESIYRSNGFLSRKLLSAALEAKKDSSYKITLGDLSATSDWGYAPEYTRAMTSILELEEGGEYVLATGTEHTVAEFAESVFRAAGLDWRQHILTRNDILTKPKRRFCGDASKLHSVIGNSIQTHLPELGRQLVVDSGQLL